MEHVGYQLLDSQNTVVQQWGGTIGVIPGVPNPLVLPNGDNVCGPSLDTDYAGYTLVRWMMEPPAPTEQDYARAIQKHLEDTATARGYDSALSLVSYLQSSNPSWAAEAAVFAAWRDSVWAYGYGELAEVQGGQREQPSVADFVLELPAITWPA